MKCDEIFAALAMLEKERGISQTFMMDKIVQALTTAYKRDHEGVENVVVDVDEGKRELKMFVQKEVVDEVENPGTQMSPMTRRPSPPSTMSAISSTFPSTTSNSAASPRATASRSSSKACAKPRAAWSTTNTTQAA